MTGGSHQPTDRASWDQRYVDGDVPWDSGDADRHLQSVVEHHGVRRGRALEVGCGSGTNSIWLAENGFEVTGVDLSPTAISRARQKAAASGVNCNLVACDFLVDRVPGGPFGFVYDRGCFHVFDAEELRSRFVAKVADLLGPDGLWHSLIGSTDGPPRDSGPPRRSANEVVAAVEPRFEILDLQSTTFDQGDHRDARAWVFVARRREGRPSNVEEDR